MNAVAMNMVATMTNSKVSTNNSKESQSSNDFNKALEKSMKSSTDNYKVEKNTKAKSINSNENDINKKANNTIDKELKEEKAKNIDDKELDEKKEIKTPDSNKNDEVKDVHKPKESKKTDDENLEEVKDLVNAVEEEVIKSIAEILNISEEKLKELMTDLNITFVDLFDNNNIKSILEKVFNTSNQGDLLTNSKVLETFKDIKETLNNILTKENINIKDLEKAINSLNQSGELLQNSNEKVTNSKTNEQTDKIKNVEVIDLRSSQSEENENNKSNTNKQIETPKEQLSGSNNESNSNTNQQSESQNQNQFENILTNVTTQKTEQVTVNGVEKTIYQQVSAKDVINQIVTNIKVELTDQKSTMYFQLQPENLGKVAFSVTSQQGNITGQFVAENATVKEAIEMNLNNLKATLQQQGIKVDEIEVVVGNTSEFFNKNQEQNQSSNYFNKNRSKKVSKVFELNKEESIDIKELSNSKNNNLYDDESSHSIDFSA